MKAEQVVNYLLANTAGVTALIDTTTPRVHYIVGPQDPTYPYITLRTISSERVEGVYTNPGYAKARIQVTCFALTAQGAMALAEQVRLALERNGSGPNGTPINSVTVYDIKIGSEVQQWVPEIEAFAHATDYIVLHAE